MKLTINQGVRDTIAELETLFNEWDALGLILGNRSSSWSVAAEAGINKKAMESAIVSCAAKILSHATRGRRYPHMTHYRNPEWMI